jgi:SAM-dependent methyltransferase
MTGKSKRPFYSEYAWAFDLLIDRPVRKECATIAAWLVERGVIPGSEILDAGCGTGRYAIELARRGYIVRGIDFSPELIEVAERSLGEAKASVTFAVGDILKQPTDRYDAVLCRGVLNDFVDDDARRAVFAAFARALRPAGTLILDVREWEASVVRKEREPVFRKSVDTSQGKLTFESITQVDRDRRQLLLSERHTLIADGHERSSDYQFAMHCWTLEELENGLSQAGFRRVAYYGAYDPAVEVGVTDRVVAVAESGQRSRG